MAHLCYLCIVFVMLSRLFIAALWSPAGKVLTAWLLLVKFNCIFITFPCGILDQVWYLFLSILDLSHLSHFYQLQILTLEVTGLQKIDLCHPTPKWLWQWFCYYCFIFIVTPIVLLGRGLCYSLFLLCSTLCRF